MTARSMLPLLLVVLTSGCCFSETQPVHVSRTPADVWRLVDPKYQPEILSKKYDRAEVLAVAGNPTIDDGEEWVYVAKFKDGSGFGVPMDDEGFPIYATNFDPTWKTIVVTFDTRGKVERIRVGSVDSSIADIEPVGYLLGIGFHRPMRTRAAPTTQTTKPSGGSD